MRKNAYLTDTVNKSLLPPLQWKHKAFRKHKNMYKWWGYGPIQRSSLLSLSTGFLSNKLGNTALLTDVTVLAKQNKQSDIRLMMYVTITVLNNKSKWWQWSSMIIMTYIGGVTVFSNCRLSENHRDTAATPTGTIKLAVTLLAAHGVRELRGRTLLSPALQSAVRPHWERAGRGEGTQPLPERHGHWAAYWGSRGGLESEEPGKGEMAQEKLSENWGQQKSNRWNGGHRTHGTGSWVGQQRQARQQTPRACSPRC